MKGPVLTFETSGAQQAPAPVVPYQAPGPITPLLVGQQDAGLNISQLMTSIMPIIVLALMFKIITPMMAGLGSSS